MILFYKNHVKNWPHFFEHTRVPSLDPKHILNKINLLSPRVAKARSDHPPVQWFVIYFDFRNWYILNLFWCWFRTKCFKNHTKIIQISLHDIS
jgi:hypothetical protein